MAEKTVEQLEEQIRVDSIIKQEREESNKLYARKIVEIILFSMVGMFCIAVITALLKLVIR